MGNQQLDFAEQEFKRVDEERFSSIYNCLKLPGPIKTFGSKIIDMSPPNFV